MVMDNMYRISHIKLENSQGSVLDNFTRHHKLAFCYPKNGFIYISLTFYVFANYICEGVRIVSDCYVLHSTSKLAPLPCFRKDDAIDLVHCSDEEDFVTHAGDTTGQNSEISDSIEHDETFHGNMYHVDEEEDHNKMDDSDHRDEVEVNNNVDDEDSMTSSRRPS